MDPQGLVIESGVFKSNTKLDHLDRLTELQDNLYDKLLIEGDATIVVIEEVPRVIGFANSFNAYRILQMYRTVAALMCHQNDLKVEGLYPKQVRSRLDYKGPGGKKSKPIFHAHLFELYPELFNANMREDEIDAIALVKSFLLK